MRRMLAAALVVTLIGVAACGSEDEEPADAFPVEEAEEAEEVEEALEQVDEPEEVEQPEESEEADEPQDAEEAEEPAGVERPVLELAAQSAGPITVTPSECRVEGYDLEGSERVDGFAFAGERAFVHHEGVRAFTFTGGDHCELALDTSLGDNGLLPETERRGSLSGNSNGRLVASGVLGSMVFDTALDQSYECSSMTGDVALSPDGNEALLHFPGRDAVEQWELSDTICTEFDGITFDSMPDIKFIAYDGGDLLIGGSDPEEVNSAGRFRDGSAVWQTGSDEIGAPGWFGWVHGMAPCDPYTCMIDTNTDKVVLFDDGDGSVVAAFDLGALLGERGWWEPLLLGDDGANYLLFNKAVDDEDGERTNFGYVIRLEVTS